ncbi:MAG TPA: winged helix-turn-helix domain-containing protein [Steroidobacteraceae bacterium]|nr:winged helix-turn-helix domain-containing protein [Steroidobacteraceae bacterium]
MDTEPLPAAPPDPSGYRVDDLLIDARMGRVTRAGAELGITGLSFDLLLTLVRAAPAAVSMDALMERVWCGVVVSPETVTQRIRLLRQSLGDSADRPRYIAVRRGRGYRLVASVKPLELNVSEASGACSIAVMPFANLTGEPGKEYLGDGMAEEIINALSAVPGLKVPARTSSFAYKGRDADVRRIARDLGVATVLEGSVRSAGERLRISARLVDASSSFPIWSQTYDRQFADLFRLQDDLAAQIVQALRNHLSINLALLPARPPPTADLQAYQLYLQARAVARGTAATQQAAFDLVEQAVRRDPDFAPALAYRAFVQVTLLRYGLGSPDTLDGAQREAERALARGPSLAEAFAALGALAQLRGDWVEAEKIFRSGLAVAASDPWLRTLYAILVLMPMGRMQQAVAQIRESYRLAPAQVFVIHQLSLVDALTGCDAEAMRLTDLSRKLGGGGPPGWELLLPYARAAALSGRYEEVRDRAVQTLPSALNDEEGVGILSVFYAALAEPGGKPAAGQALRRFVPRLVAANVDSVTKLFFVYMFATLDAFDEAYELANRWLDQSEQSGMTETWYSLWAPEMRPFRLDRRFQALVRRLKMTAYWQQFGPPDGCELQGNELRVLD